MSIRLGTTDPSAFRLGNTAVSKLMLGNTEVWSAVDPDAADYFARIVSAGSSISSANQAAVNEFVVGCKADGIWSAIKASCLLCAADSLAGALVPLVGTAPTNNNFVSGDYSRTLGLTGNGSTKTLNSNRSNSADPQNNQHAAVFVNSSISDSGLAVMGSGAANNGALILATSGGTRSRNGTAQAGSLLTVGLAGVSRSNASTYERRQNSTSSTQTSVSQTPYTGNIFIFSTENGSGSPILTCARRLSFYSIGEALNLSLLDARLVTLMAALT